MTQQADRASRSGWFLRGAAAALALSAIAGPAPAGTLFGFTPFPFDATAEAVTRVGELLRDNASLHALHFDDGVPWSEMLDGKPLPEKVRREWDDQLRRAPAGRPLYLALTPIDKDRKSLAPALGGSGLPLSLRLAKLDSDRVKQGYLEYVRRAVAHFKPQFLNIGIEAGELAARDPSRWPQYESLYLHVAGAIRREFPELRVGMSFGLQSLRKPGMVERTRNVVAASDYVCVSFYPHASPFGERFGEPPLPAGDAAWQQPLDELRAFTGKPLAVCETGYLTRTAQVKSFDLTLRGDAGAQERYVRDLARIARRDDYLFVVWFLAADYDRLYERMGGDKPGNDVNLLWRNIGLWDAELKPKPALKEWQKALASQPAAPAAAVVSPPPATTAPAPGVTVGFTQSSELFQAAPGSRMALDDGGARWSFEYRRDEWMWAVRELPRPLPVATARMTLRLRSDREGPLFLQLEGNDGQAFFVMLQPSLTWRTVSLPMSDFQPDPAKRRDGVLRPDRIVKILIADAGARAKATGARQVWLADWRFE